MSAIGIFDSGVGGLSVLRALRQELPNESLIYMADQAHVPYGRRSLEEVRVFSERITRFLLDQGARLIVVACNTASAAALLHLRKVFPDIPFVGMEPAVKPAAETTRSGVVGVLATPATFQGRLYASVVERFANSVTLLQHTCPGLVEQIESGQLKSPETRRILEQALDPMLVQEIDTVVLGCTHYPFVIPLIEEITGPFVRVIDPAPAVARQAKHLWEQLINNQADKELWNQGINHTELTHYITSGEPSKLETALVKLLSIETNVIGAYWQGTNLMLRK